MENGTKSRVLLIGAGSTVGEAILTQLLLRRDEFYISVFDEKRSHNMTLFEKHRDAITVYYGDITDRKALEEACYNQDFVIHNLSLSRIKAQKRIKMAEDVNVIGTENVVRSVEAFSPHAFLLYMSSISVYGDRLKSPMISAENPLGPSLGDNDGITRLQAEKIVQESSLEWTIFRPAVILSKRTLRLNATLFNIPLSNRIETIHARDLADAAVSAFDFRMQLWGRIFNVGGGENCRTVYGEFLSKIFGIAGMKHIDVPPYAFAHRNGIGGYYADGDILENILHFRKTSLAEYFTDLTNSQTLLSKVGSSLLSGVRGKTLLSHSDPLRAHKSGDRSKTKYFFDL